MSDIIEEKEIPIEDEDIPTDSIDYDESVEEDIVLAEWDKDEYEAEAEAEPETH
jgi:hypothetical protein